MSSSPPPPTIVPMLVLAMAVGLGAGRAHEVGAQASPLVLEVHAGAAFPLASFASGARVGEGAGPGASFGVDFALPGGARWVPYLGFAQHRFGCEAAGCGAGGRYVATGFHGGFRFVPLPERGVLPWARLGVMTTRVETGALGGPDAGVSKMGVGAEAGAGVHVGAVRALALNPSLRWVAANSELPGGSLLRLRYWVADLALVLSF